MGVSRIVICGGGLAGSLAAIAIAKRRPDLDLLLLEKGESFGGNHIWSFFDTDIAEKSRWLLDSVASRRWPDHEVRFPRRERVIPVGYNSIRSHDLDNAVRTILTRDQYRVRAEVSRVARDHVVVSGERIESDCVIDARGPGPMPGLDLGWQKFLGRVYQFRRWHRVARPVIMDARIGQPDGFGFLYLLPLSPTELLVEETHYSSSPLLNTKDIGHRLDSFASATIGEQGDILSEEQGVLPVLVDGALDRLWPHDDPVPRLGLHGGFFHPTTGYSLPDALANAVLLTEQRTFSSAAIGTVLHQRAVQIWRDRRFFQLLNRMLFRAADPAERYRVLEHFYRLPPAVISRFYAARLTFIDKVRILSGRPPVPIKRAVSALFRKAA